MLKSSSSGGQKGKSCQLECGCFSKLKLNSILIGYVLVIKIKIFFLFYCLHFALKHNVDLSLLFILYP